MLQASVLDVSYFIFDVCCKCVYLDIADVFHTYIISVLSECCKNRFDIAHIRRTSAGAPSSCVTDASVAPTCAKQSRHGWALRTRGTGAGVARETERL